MSAIWFTQAELEKQRAAKDTKDVAGSAESQQSEKKSSSYFYSINKQTNLEMMTFVTTSALQSYGTTQDRLVRVVYKLEQDPAHEGNFRLMRKEIFNVTESIDEQALKAGKFYELAANIGSLQTTFYYIDQQELQKQQKAQAEKDDNAARQQANIETKQLIGSVKEWKKEKKPEKDKNKSIGSEQEQTKEDDLGGALAPKIIELKISFGRVGDLAAREYKLSFYIPSNIDHVVKPIKKEQAVATQAVSDQAQPAGAGVEPIPTNLQGSSL
jgi:hypothetical protein